MLLSNGRARWNPSQSRTWLLKLDFSKWDVFKSRAAMLFATYYQILDSNLSASRHRMTLDKPLTVVHLGLPGRYIHSVYEELNRLRGETLWEGSVLSRATASNSSRKNIGLSKLSPDSILYRNAGYYSEN
jgi:hypothetical protein